ncbi:MAG: 2-C-methyl-D-erythritol 4-phosphate cytidylyltransferase, partial [Candidatus Dormibacteraeota bacterium]|nr:2-C-methyl-D-erythritol 4-phosphate cytidylyltransferase [Candidatus Dormibacteraeota bacterium]
MLRPAVAVVPAGGTAGSDLRVAGRSVLDWTLSALAEAGGLVEIVVVGELDSPAVEAPIPIRTVRLEAGRGRLQALRAGLAAAAGAPRVLVHDGCRPMSSAALVHAVLQSAEGGGAVAAVQARNTLKEVREGRVCGTVPRERLYQVQSPAVFERVALEQALARADSEGWNCADELELAARAGLRPLIVPGDPLNVPVTVPESVPFAELVKGRAPPAPEGRPGLPGTPEAARRGGVAAVVVAAGAGRRMGAARNKVFLPVGGRPILAR